MIYFIADLHFGHKNIITYESRPFPDVPTMDSKLIEYWNEKVSPEDTIFILGDFTLSHNFENCKNLCSQLNGHKILIRGNHDSLNNEKYIAAGFEEVHPDEIIASAIDSSRRLVLSHYPPKSVNEFDYYLYGHVHSKYCAAEEFPNALCVSCERINYTPVSMSDIGELLRQKRAGLYKKVEKPADWIDYGGLKF